MRAANLARRIVSVNSELVTANLCIKVTQQNVIFAILNVPQCSLKSFVNSSLILQGLENVGALAENFRNRSLSENFKRTPITRDTHACTHARTHPRTHARTHARSHSLTHARTHTHTHTNHDHPLSLPN